MDRVRGECSSQKKGKKKKKKRERERVLFPKRKKNGWYLK